MTVGSLLCSVASSDRFARHLLKNDVRFLFFNNNKTDQTLSHFGLFHFA